MRSKCKTPPARVVVPNASAATLPGLLRCAKRLMATLEAAISRLGSRCHSPNRKEESVPGNHAGRAGHSNKAGNTPRNIVSSATTVPRGMRTKSCHRAPLVVGEVARSSRNMSGATSVISSTPHPATTRLAPNPPARRLPRRCRRSSPRSLGSHPADRARRTKLLAMLKFQGTYKVAGSRRFVRTFETPITPIAAPMVRGGTGDRLAEVPTA